MAKMERNRAARVVTCHASVYLALSLRKGEIAVVSILRVLVAHGSRDSRSAVALQQLAANLASQLSSAPAIAFLEGPYPPLASQLIRQAQVATERGASALKVYPLFLLSGTHTTEDLPEAIAVAQSQTSVPICLQDHWGDSISLKMLLRSQVNPALETWLVAHGSRRSAANQQITQLAAELGWSTVFCRADPLLRDRLVQTQPDRLLPLLLFPGPIYDSVQAICMAAQTDAALAPPLSQWPNFLEAIAQWLQGDRGISDNQSATPTRFPQQPGEIGEKILH